MSLSVEIQKKSNNLFPERKINSSKDIVDLEEVREIRNALQEHLLLIGLDFGNNLKSVRLIGLGTSSQINIDTKEVIRMSLITGSEKVVLVHNHPSNSLTPSKADKDFSNITSRLLKIFNIDLLDHIIVTEKDFASMRENLYIDRNFTNQDLTLLDQTLLLEENQKLKQEIENLRFLVQCNDKNCQEIEEEEER